MRIIVCPDFVQGSLIFRCKFYDSPHHNRSTVLRIIKRSKSYIHSGSNNRFSDGNDNFHSYK